MAGERPRYESSGAAFFWLFEIWCGERRNTTARLPLARILTAIANLDYPGSNALRSRYRVINTTTTNRKRTRGWRLDRPAPRR